MSWIPPDGNGGAPIIGYLVIPYLNGSMEAPITYLSTTTEVISGISNGDSYTFAVEALNAEGAGPPSMQSAPVTPTSVPGVPTDLTGVAGNGQVSLAWTAPIDNGGTPIIGYTVIPYDGGVPGGPIGYPSTTTTETVGGLTNGSTYAFAVEAKNADGSGGVSVQSSSFTPSTLPGAATGVTATGGNDRVTLSWTAPAQDGGTPIDGYIVTPYIGSTAQSWSLFMSPDTSEMVTGLTNGDRLYLHPAGHQRRRDRSGILTDRDGNAEHDAGRSVRRRRGAG
jgi:predicted RNA-binding protein with TRAM domain